MKKTILTFLSILFLASCSKEDSPAVDDPLAKLPPETQTGANTFGCIISNQVFYPRDGVGTIFVNGTKGMVFWGSGDGPNYTWNEIEINNAKDGKPASSMIIHFQSLFLFRVGEYIWHPTNFQNSIDGLMQNYVHARIYDSNINTWKYYGSYENSGKVNITRFDFTNRIVSGNFSGKLRLYNGTEEIDILQGRFDFNWSTLDTKLFP
jgi:hypothetical protein